MNPAWSNDQLNIKFAFSREGNVLTINLEAANQTLADEITDFVFQGILSLPPIHPSTKRGIRIYPQVYLQVGGFVTKV